MAIIFELFIPVSLLVASLASFLGLISFQVLLLCLFATAAVKLASFLKLENALNNHSKLPRLLADFPVVGTSPEKYHKSFDKIRTFISDVTSEKSSKISLNEEDINNIHLQGKQIKKHERNLYFPLDPVILILQSIPIMPSIPRSKYFYYHIQDSGILEKRIQYPDISTGISGVRTESTFLSLEIADDQPCIRRCCVEVNGRSLRRSDKAKQGNLLSRLFIFFFEDKGVLESSLSNSSFLFHIFGVTPSPQENLMEYEDYQDYKVVESVIEKITKLEIVDETLVIEAKGIKSS